MPEKLGAYEIRAQVGSGGMGVVYRGWDARLDREVAIKTLWPELAVDRAARERFIREARAAAAVSHPNVTQIYDIGEEKGEVFFAMEFVEGRSLAHLLKEEKRLPVEYALALTRQAAAGLKAAADRGIIHRDIKPSNLVLTADGVLKVTDFGLAKKPADAQLTSTGLVIGTPHYISPEQATGDPMDLRGDIYSLGATLYEMLTGQPPFPGDNAVQVILRHTKEPVPPPRRLRPDLPPAVAQLVVRMLSKKPGARPQSYDELILLLDRLLAPGGRTLAHGVSTPAGGEAQGASATGTGRTAAASITARPLPTPTDAGPERPAASGGSMLVLIALITLGGVAAWGLVREVEPAPPAAAPASTESSPAPAPTDAGAVEPAPRRGIRLPFVGGKGELEIFTKFHEITEDGRLRVSGQVNNTGDGLASGSRIKVTLTRETGEVIDSVTVPLSPPRVRPGDGASFEAFFPDPEATVHIGLELSWVS